jgi:hypothetical protein
MRCRIEVFPKNHGGSDAIATCRRSASAAMPAKATRLCAKANSRTDVLWIQESVR